MAYIGNTPAESYASFERQVFTIVNSQTAYTLTHAVTNENDIRLVVNNVVQEPGSGKAYTASGTSLTLSAALVNGTDEMYCVYLGRALQTVNPPNASVGSAQIADSLISGKTDLGATPADTDELLISDAGTLKRVDFSHLKSANTPAFSAKRTSTQAIANNTMTTVLFDTEVFDSDGKYDPSTGKFTPTVVGKYFVQTNLVLGGLSDNDYLYWLLKKNGSTFSYGQIFSGGSNAEIGATISGTIDLDADDDVRVDVYQGSGSSKNLPANGCVFSAYRIIGA